MNVPFERPADTPGPHEISWPILGGGFAVGLLCGAFWLMSDRNADSAEPVAEPSTPVAASTDVELENQRLRHELEVTRLQARIAELERQLAAARTAESALTNPRPDRNLAEAPRPAPVPSGPVVRSQPASGSGPPSGRATLDYWNRMNQIIAREAEMRRAPSGGVKASNAGSFLDRRIAAGEYASSELSRLGTQGVDPEVVALARAVAGWYGEGVSICETGKELFSGGNSGPHMRAAATQYQNAEKSHAAAVSDINAQGERTRETMTRRYRLTFPPLN
ncbi:hypothetical protein Mal4_01910 [Maioricimonas rarisocia]|uniref:Uncharacterized protein n=1 Tax=Maioricimonas rarisocia TaxID=2528026 RepID=A0A517Z0H5_9PLAN|nr:hypothetical protein [Maioricimonas rarisocia]QDU35909.1 hypothetical protein Mal4_01910 [Maioricimonas rarisocia]